MTWHGSISLVELMKLTWAIFKVRYIVPFWINVISNPLDLILQISSRKTASQSLLYLVFGIVAYTSPVKRQFIRVLQLLGVDMTVVLIVSCAAAATLPLSIIQTLLRSTDVDVDVDVNLKRLIDYRSVPLSTFTTFTPFAKVPFMRKSFFWFVIHRRHSHTCPLLEPICNSVDVRTSI